MKLKNLVLLIVNNYNNKHLVKAKLQKLLYFCDFQSYSQIKKSITALQYIKDNRGLIIKDLEKALQELDKDNLLKIIKTSRKDKNEDVISFTSKISNSKELQKSFSNIEKSIIEAQNQKFLNSSLEEIVNIFCHDFPYLATERSQIIGYDLVFYRDDEEEEGNEDYSDLTLDKRLIDAISNL